MRFTKYAKQTLMCQLHCMTNTSICNENLLKLNAIEVG